MNVERFEKRYCGRPLSAGLRVIEDFHGWKAPGLVLGLFMVDLAQRAIPKDVEADAVVETRHCLPDAVQLFTPCTVGNGWLKILDWDKFALTLYDRRSYFGSRVWFDPEKARRHPHLYNWFMRRVPKKDLPLDVLLDAVIAAGTEPFSTQPVMLHSFRDRIKKKETLLCPTCGEAYRADHGPICRACADDGYYVSVEKTGAAVEPVRS